MEIGDIGELVTETVERLDVNGIEDASMEVGQQLLIPRAKAARPTHRGVGVGLDERPSLSVKVAPAHLDLVGERAFTLVLPALAGVNANAHCYAFQLEPLPRPWRIRRRSC